MERKETIPRFCGMNSCERVRKSGVPLDLAGMAVCQICKQEEAR